MNFTKINNTIEEQHTKHIQKILTNISIYYKINKKDLFDKFIHKDTQVKTYKNKKKSLDPEYKCMARKQDGTQCTRRRRHGDYCGKHIEHKLGRIDRPIDDSLFKKKKKCIVVKTENINNKDYIIEDTTGIIFDGNIKKPTVIGKKLGDNSIHFLDPVDKTTTESSTETDNIEQNHIVNILSKLGNIEPTLTKEYDDFNINNVSSNNITIPTEYIEDKEYCVEIDY